MQDLTAELLEVMDELRTAGRIGRYGLATGVGESVAATTQAPPFTDVLQVADSVVRPVRRRHAALDPPLFVHSVLRDGLLALEQPARSAGLGGDGLAEQILAEAARQNPGGTVLFSSTVEARISAYGSLAGRDPAVVVRPEFTAVLASVRESSAAAQ